MSHNTQWREYSDTTPSKFEHPSCSTCIYKYEPPDNISCMECEELDDEGFATLKNYTPIKDSVTLADKVMNNCASRYDKPDGFNGSYYTLPPFASELADLIDHKDMNFNIGNIFKACYRLGEKDGFDAEYDLKKMLFFIKRELFRRGLEDVWDKRD